MCTPGECHTGGVFALEYSKQHRQHSQHVNLHAKQYSHPEKGLLLRRRWGLGVAAPSQRSEIDESEAVACAACLRSTLELVTARMQISN